MDRQTSKGDIDLWYCFSATMEECWDICETARDEDQTLKDAAEDFCETVQHNIGQHDIYEHTWAAEEIDEMFEVWKKSSKAKRLRAAKDFLNGKYKYLKRRA